MSSDDDTIFLFQLTHLLRGATKQAAFMARPEYISTHAPLARCDQVGDKVLTGKSISTHAPLARCD